MYNEHMIDRIITPLIKKSPKSILLLGPRQVGKTTLVKSLKPQITVQLADESEFFSFTSNPSELRTRLESYRGGSRPSIFIDEIQRLPGLLNTVQSLIDEDKSLKFYLSGSSARKLKRGGANLLPGRVLNFYLGPLVAAELEYEMDTKHALSFGSLPEAYTQKDDALRRHLLKTYVVNYISEEIKAEALVRKIDAFSRFTATAIEYAGLFVDYSKLGKKAKISRHAVDRFFEIFEDTMIGRRLWPHGPSLDSADLVKHPKFYLFDNGVYNAVMGNFTASEDRCGVLSEQLVFNQIIFSAWSRLRDVEVSTFRTRAGLEVDFIVTLEKDVFPVEVKTSSQLYSHDVDALRKIKSYLPRSQPGMVFHLGKESKKVDGFWCHPWQRGLREMGL